MTDFTTVASGQVALLIDFENLVRAVDEEDIDCEALFRLAEQYGRVLVANAYADWRMKEVNQYQTDLYGLGIDLIHVLGRRWGAALKNAVDVKMAVDAISLMSSLPHIDVYVIASGDRDFIHVLKELRRHGKTIVGVSPSSAVSEDFAGLCDRFLRYEALTDSAHAIGAEGIEKAAVTTNRIDTLRAALKKSRYESDATLRRETLVRLFHAMYGSPFTLPEVHDTLEDDGGVSVSMTDVVKYARLLFYGRVLLPETGQEDVLFRERQMLLDPNIGSPESLVLAYETGIVMRLTNSSDSTIGAADVAGVLGLDADEDGIAYCDGLLASAGSLAAKVASARPAGVESESTSD